MAEKKANLHAELIRITGKAPIANLEEHEEIAQQADADIAAVVREAEAFVQTTTDDDMVNMARNLAQLDPTDYSNLDEIIVLPPEDSKSKKKHRDKSNKKKRTKPENSFSNLEAELDEEPAKPIPLNTGSKSKAEKYEPQTQDQDELAPTRQRKKPSRRDKTNELEMKEVKHESVEVEVVDETAKQTTQTRNEDKPAAIEKPSNKKRHMRKLSEAITPTLEPVQEDADVVEF